ncbi:MAG TPA: phosphate-starvation-inducible PsiE family protein [Candidatus Binatia bacterium]|nr:phosphate-starvation-inducible PsiE family protein [Candidatus Binatia bacterium]
MAKTAKPDVREAISSGFTRFEDVVYVGLGLLLAASAFALLVVAVSSFGQAVLSGKMREIIVDLLDQILLILMILEILYTVQLSFRERTLIAEPFLIVGLIAAIRRILVLTAEFSKPEEIVETAFRNAMFELGLLTVLIMSLVLSLYLLKKHRTASATRE